MLTLGIETSCDETSIGIVGEKVFTNIIMSQEVHSKFGGVVPELASREHLNNFLPLFEKALKESGKRMEEIDLISVTVGPGLAGSLIVGLSFAKSLSLIYEKPFIGVNHIEGHIFSLFLEDEVELPALILVVSGGHTELLIMEEFFRYRLLGRTRDDACGEAFDKVAKLMGLPYPGGPHIDRLASLSEKRIDFPVFRTHGYDFSYSGLKTAVKYYIREKGLKDREAIASGFQFAAIEQLMDRITRAANEFNIETLGIVGGVSANSYLRRRAKETEGTLFKRVLLPPLKYCIDNGAMIALLGRERYKRYGPSPFSLGVFPSLEL